MKLKHILVSTTTLLLLDMLWIYFFMGNKYKIMIKNIQGSDMKVNIIYASIAYILMIIGLNYIVLPLLDINNITFKNCMSTGFLFGIILYGVYDFTIGAVLNKWDMKLAVIDVIWGGFVYFMSCYILKFIN